MKKYALNDITLFQFIFMIHGAQLGIGIFSLPSDLAKVSGTDGWISLIIGWAITVVISMIIVQIMKQHPDDTLYDLLPRYFGKWIGKLLHILVISYFLFAFFTSGLASLTVIKQTLLPKTPNYWLMILIILPIYTIARNHVRILARYAEITFWGFLWLLPLYLFALKEGVWLNLLPVLKDGLSPVWAGIKTTSLSFQGFETIFMLYPFLKRKDKALQGVLIANTLTLIIYLCAVIVCFLYFSPDGITNYNWPPLRVLKSLEFRFLERFEVIWIVAYLFLLSRVWIINLYFASLGSSQLIGKQDHRPHLRIYLLFFLILSLFFKPGYSKGQYLTDWLAYAGIAFAFVFPCILWPYTALVRKWRKGH
ncbi:hypothetical protein A8709_15425 [Paenibacillus pectinilyticus]|uniref:Uncharacterized protein n=1 Tax=Paenibacillus pectinilyticus TaxID=512399 RepID=A0A1C1A4I8_9BACL|nr:endospore germination permease [Paenibacillus pectinilyticus]OCT15465.1 hypothetical protein A8709_15425 [Paenibacillus pectinilyticus]